MELDHGGRWLDSSSSSQAPLAQDCRACFDLADPAEAAAAIVAAPIDAEFELLDYEEKRQCVSVPRTGF
jgi:hypothetical protein